MLLSSPAGNDLPFDVSLCEQGRNFSNKIWNATRLIKGWEVADIEQPESSIIAVEWFENKFQHILKQINDAYSKYRISEVLMLTYRLVWDDFCSWYLESVKPDYQKPIDRNTIDSTISFMENLLKLLHPFMPFLTEEIWHLLDDERSKDIIVSEWPKTTSIKKDVLSNFDYATEIVSAIRTIRKDKQIPNKDSLKLFIKLNEATSKSMDALVSRLTNLSELSYISDNVDGAFSFRVNSNEFFVPLFDNIDVGAELEKLRLELDYTQGFLKSVMGKLSNERFINNAPKQVVEMERKKQSDAEAKIAVLQEQIKAIS